MSNTWMVYVEIAIMVASMAGTVAYETANQQKYVQEDAVLTPAA